MISYLLSFQNLNQDKFTYIDYVVLKRCHTLHFRLRYLAQSNTHEHLTSDSNSNLIKAYNILLFVIYQKINKNRFTYIDNVVT